MSKTAAKVHFFLHICKFFRTFAAEFNYLKIENYKF